MENKKEIHVPENFRGLINDFTRDLSTTFPEYSYLWKKWTATVELSNTDVIFIFEFIMKAYPERFFDILYQNEDIFKPDCDTNTIFLPNVDFKLLFNCKDITETTKKAIWKYLQLILFSIISSVEDKSKFGSSLNMFDNIEESDLQDKLEKAMKDISGFFEKSSTTDSGQGPSDAGQGPNNSGQGPNNSGQGPSESEQEKMFENMFENMPKMPNMDEFKNSFDFKNMPKPEDLHEHLKDLFDGKIGKLAKEMAEELTNDITGMMGGDDMSDVKTTEDVLKKLMKNPKKMMDLVKTIGSKLDSKMKSGDISQDEIMKEASELINKMKGMGGGNADINEMFKNMAKQMGGMGGMGKNTRVDTNAMTNMMKKQSMRERLRDKMDKKKQVAAMVQQIQSQQQQQQQQQQQPQQQLTNISSNDNKYVFKTGEIQEKSYIEQSKDIDELMNDLGLTEESTMTKNAPISGGNKKNKKAKGKK